MSCLRFCLSIILVCIALQSCVKLSNERYNRLTIDERRALSAEYTQLAKRLEMGSAKNMQLLDKAVRINPKNDLAWRELSLPYLYAGMYEEWNQHIVKAIELNAQAWQAWRGYDRLFFFRDYAGALFDLDASDTLTRNQVDYPQNISVDYLRGLCYFGLKDYDKSVEYFQSFVQDETIKLGEGYLDESVFIYLGLIAIRQNKLKTAIGYFQRGNKFEESFADFNFHLAKVYCILDETELAQKELDIARNKFEDNNRLRGYRFEAIEQIYLSDIDALQEQLDVSTQLQEKPNNQS